MTITSCFTFILLFRGRGRKTNHRQKASVRVTLTVLIFGETALKVLERFLPVFLMQWERTKRGGGKEFIGTSDNDRASNCSIRGKHKTKRRRKGEEEFLIAKVDAKIACD
jgi:hypothetical protein